jgi:hypothetical protein
MIRLYSETIEELREEMIDKRNQIAKESVISTLIGLEQKLDEVKLEVHMVNDFVKLSLHIKTDEYKETFEKNKEALIQLEEYELLHQMNKYLN